MEYKVFKFKEIETIGEGTFTGYASTPILDVDDDIMMPGAFKKTLKENKGKVYLLHEHNPAARLGVVYLEEDDKGLNVTKGIFNLAKQLSVDVWNDLRFYANEGLKLGLSIGFTIPKSKFKIETLNGKVVRRIFEVNLFETSLVTFPANPTAVVSNIKSKLSENLSDEELVIMVKNLAQTYGADKIKSLLATEADKAIAVPQEHTTEQVKLKLNVNWLNELKKL